jgi:response regulator of citrate/malate metabolism
MKITRSKLRKIVKEALLKEVDQKDPEEATRAYKAREQALESVEDIRVNKLPQAKTGQEREQLKKQLQQFVNDFNAAHGEYMLAAFGDKSAMEDYVKGTAKGP